MDAVTDTHVMSLCLILHINLGLSLRKTSQALKDLYNISISHRQIANYCKTAAICIKPFVDNYDYKPGKVFTADETYIKVRGIKAYIWFIMDAASYLCLPLPPSFFSKSLPKPLFHPHMPLGECYASLKTGKN